MNIQSDSAARVCSHIHMTNIQCERKRESRARLVCVCVRVCVESPDGNVVEIQNHTDTSVVWKMFGHSFVSFKVSTKTSTTTFVCGLELCVVVSFLCFIIFNIGFCQVHGEKGRKFGKGGFSLVTLNQQQLFGTFNNY